MEVRYLPAHLHNRPERIVPAVESGRSPKRPAVRSFVAYADCGTGGALDAMLARHPGVARLPGAHCYEVFAGSALFAELADAEPGTFFLTDFLARHFEALVWQGLGLDRHPELLATCTSRNYRRVVLLSQSESTDVIAAGRAAAERLGLRLRAPPRRPRPARCGDPRRRDVEGRVMARRRQRGRRDHVARHPGPGERPGRSRAAPGAVARRFQRAIDRAKRKAKIRTAQDDVAQWRGVSRPLDGDARPRRRPRPTGSTPSTARSGWQSGLRRRLGARRRRRRERTA